jgi:hypothetical protein
MERLVPNSYIRQRKAISASEQPFLEAIAKVLNEHESYWPISLRRVHYSLLNQNVVRSLAKGPAKPVRTLEGGGQDRASASVGIGRKGLSAMLPKSILPFDHRDH